jgi:ABC-type multidrug transport system fused ATPase/permease subunit
MTSIRMVKAFGREAHQQKQFGQESSKSAELGLQLAKLEAGYVRAVDMIGALATCVVVWWGVHRIRAGALTPGDLLVFVQYVRGVYAPIRELAKQSARISKGKVALERIVEVLEKDVAVKDSPNARPARALRGHVEFQACCFEYKPGQPVLHDVSFRAEPGQVVALVGLSGAGKSTIMSLIPRLYDPTSGRVLIDGVDLRDYQQESLRDQISLVLQDSILLQTTIIENILYGRPDATMEEVYSAAMAAGVDQFVDRLSHRYKTVVGPRGATLSGGERQRVAIARAMVRGAPILLLDEPTTGLDVQSESAVMQALGRLMQGKTTLVISHKLELIKRADRILVVEGGRIVQSGTHDELIAARGPYAHLHAVSANGHGFLARERHARTVET